jgi:hypothetical protein
LNGCSPGHVDQLVAGQLALLDQIYHGQKPLPVLDQEAGQLLFVDFPLLAYRMVRCLHGGSPFKVSQPDSFRIRLDRRSTFNYSRDILLFGTTYYSLVGLHASHVVVGLFMLSLVLVFSIFGLVTEEHSEKLEVLSLYWHFVDAV